MTTRRRFVGVGGLAGAGLMLPFSSILARRAFAAQTSQIPLAGSAIPKFVDPLPDLKIVDKTGGGSLTLKMKEFRASVMPSTFLPGTYQGTYVWGYLNGQNGQTPRPTYLGPVIIAKRNVPIEVTWVNELGTVAGTNVKAWKYSTDVTLHWADPLNNEANDCAHMGGIPAYGSECALNYGEDINNPGTYLPVPIPACVHLHGGEVPPQLDGGPDAWFLSQAPIPTGYPNAATHGHGYYTKNPLTDPANSAVYRYPNSQEAAMIWFHDHLLGATRLNVYAGLAGGYILTDPALALAPGLHPLGLDNGGTLELITPLVIQDRMFDTDGQLFFPADSANNILWTPNPEHPYWVPEFVGDTIVVNGKVWPTFGTAAAPKPRKRYRFLFLNGSNARTYELFLADPVTKVMGPPIWVIGTDGGYLDTPQKIDPNAATNNKLVMMPGERYDVIIDFNDQAWLAANPNFSGTLILRNTGRTPYPNGAAPNGSTLGQVLKLFISKGTAPTDNTYNPAGGGFIRTNSDQRIVRLTSGGVAPVVPTTQRRQLTLNEVMGMPQNAINPVTNVMTAYPGGPLEILVNNTKYGGLSVDTTKFSDGVRPDFALITTGGIDTYYSELPKEGTTEVWEIINLTADAHPMHTHLTQFQLINRQNFNAGNYNKAYAAAFPGGLFIGAFGPPADYKAGKTWSALDTFNGASVTTFQGGNPDVTPFLQGPVRLPAPQEIGWKDTIMAPPGMVTRIAVRYTPTDYDPAKGASSPSPDHFPFNPNGGHGFVWHCHIIDHEDNEMMRPLSVEPKSVTRTYKGPADGGTDF